MPLKMLVICLGLVLMGGTVFVFAAIAQKAGKEMHRCGDVTVKLESKGMPMAVAVPDSNTIALTIVKGQESKVLTIDRCTGKILQTVTVVE